jgi:hypothetical protein
MSVPEALGLLVYPTTAYGVGSFFETARSGGESWRRRLGAQARAGAHCYWQILCDDRGCGVLFLRKTVISCIKAYVNIMTHSWWLLQRFLSCQQMLFD